MVDWSWNNYQSINYQYPSCNHCTFQSYLAFLPVKDPKSPPPAYLVCAGVEPKHFTALFPHWEVDTIVRDIALEVKHFIAVNVPIPFIHDLYMIPK